MCLCTRLHPHTTFSLVSSRETGICGLCHIYGRHKMFWGHASLSSVSFCARLSVNYVADPSTHTYIHWCSKRLLVQASRASRRSNILVSLCVFRVQEGLFTTELAFESHPAKKTRRNVLDACRLAYTCVYAPVWIAIKSIAGYIDNGIRLDCGHLLRSLRKIVLRTIDRGFL